MLIQSHTCSSKAVKRAKVQREAELREAEANNIDIEAVLRERLLSAYESSSSSDSKLMWGKQSSVPLVVKALLHRAAVRLGPNWSQTVLIIDGTVEQRMELTKLAPDTRHVFARLGDRKGAFGTVTHNTIFILYHEWRRLFLYMCKMAVKDVPGGACDTIIPHIIPVYVCIGIYIYIVLARTLIH